MGLNKVEKLGIIEGMVAAKTNAKKVKKQQLKAERARTEGLRAAWQEVCRKQKNLMVMMIVLLIASVALLVFSVTTLRPQSTVVVVGYGDVYGEIAGISGGYRSDSWANMLAFPILALIYGVVHNLLVLRVYRKYGDKMAMLVAGASILLVVGTFVSLARLIGEW